MLKSKCSNSNAIERRKFRREKDNDFERQEQIDWLSKWEKFNKNDEFSSQNV